MKFKYLIFLLIVCIASCKKSWFEAKQDISLTVPATINDLQLLLDNPLVFNRNAPELGEMGTDDYFMSTSSWMNLGSVYEKYSYIWAKDIFEGVGNIPDWNNPYSQI